MIEENDPFSLFRRAQETTNSINTQLNALTLINLMSQLKTSTEQPYWTISRATYLAIKYPFHRCKKRSTRRVRIYKKKYSL